MGNTAKDTKDTKTEVKEIKFGHMTSAGVYHLPHTLAHADAKKNGDTLYFEKECDKGHKAPRYTRDKVCKECYRLKKLAAKAKKEKELEQKHQKLNKVANHITHA